MKTTFIPIDYDYFDWQGRNYAKIIGRDSSGKRICVIDFCNIFFWAILKENLEEGEIKSLINKISSIKLDVKGRQTKVEKVELHDKNFLGKPVKALKIFATNYKDLHDIADKLDMPEIEKRRGYDLGFITHYIIERNILPLTWYEIEGEMLNNSYEFGGIDSALDVDFCIKLKTAKKTEPEPIINPKILAYDIETDEFQLGKGQILMISLVSNNLKKVITWKKSEKTSEQNFVEYVEDEAELIEKFTEYVKKESPDFLTGYFSDGFDLPYLKARAEKHKIKLALGLDGSQPIFHKGNILTGKISGVVHVDLLRFVQTAYSQYMQSETLSLNDIAFEFLGERKKDFVFKSISKLTNQDWKDYFEYNLQDSMLTYNLFLKFWPDFIAFSRVMQEPLFEVSRNGMSKNVESYIIHNLPKFNEIPEKRPTHEEISKRRLREKYEGAFVFQPIPGLYENLALFDFTSYWPSIIATFNLSKSTLLEKKPKAKNVLEVEIAKGKKAYFEKEPGFFPEMLKEIISLRKKFKQELKKGDDAVKRARSNAFKLLANASYGYQGFFGARYYCPEASAATTAISRNFIKEVIKKIDSEGFRTIYSDTDSIAFLLNKKTKKQTLELLEKLNKELPGIMELELEEFYKRGIWVTKRTGEFGAKKKYALVDEKGKLKIRGFETVRRDWCNLARKTQNKVLRLILEDGDNIRAVKYVKEIVKKLKDRKIEIEEILIRTQLKKPLNEYKAISPHVIAAQKMQKQKIPIDEGALIEYFIAETREKKKLVRDKVKLPNEKGEYNIKYYLGNQILPAVENIFQVFNVNVNDLIQGSKQKKLGEF
ncbi:ribonuclease H-like domain-containing protein [Candidatus Pacearchaeota archaeon]|nr:ribonuclease H-like domain-containing protein [Candidatus Pacearchaeota archaeon]